LTLAAIRVGLCALIVAGGLVLRAYGHGLDLPVGIVKYGGSVLWGTMVYFLLAICRRGRSRLGAASLAMAIAVAVELSRLYHTLRFDAFRRSLPGALLLGRIFSLWNILAYVCGILLGAALDSAIGKLCAPAPTGKCAGARASQAPKT
jgi:hypothetical protein